MPCDAVAFGWGQVSEANLIKILEKDPELVRAVLQALLQGQSDRNVEVKREGAKVALTQGYTEVTYLPGGKVQVVNTVPYSQAETRALAQQCEKALKKAALQRLRYIIGKGILDRGGKIMGIEERNGATVFKVEVKR